MNEQVLDFHCHVGENIKRFREQLEGIPSVEKTEEKTDGDIVVVTVTVSGPTCRASDNNYQYVLGVGHGIRKANEAAPTSLDEIVAVMRQAGPFSGLRTDMEFEGLEHLEHALGKALVTLWDEGIHPLKLAELALEDANHHDLCEQVRGINTESFR